MKAAQSMSHAPIRPEILRRFHEATFGGGGLPDEAFAGATFGEYLDLMRTTFPRLSPYLAARRSPGGIFKDLAEGFKAEYDEAERKEKAAQAVRKPSGITILNRPAVDLAEESLDPGAGTLLLNRIKEVTGFAALPGMKSLRVLKLYLCGTSEPPAPSPLVPLEEIDLTECGRAILERILPMTDSRVVKISYLDSPTLDLSLLRGHRKLRELACTWGFALGLRHLRGIPLEGAYLNDFAADGTFFETLGSWSGSLLHLRVAPMQAFPPASLPALPRLERIAIPGYPEYRKEWIDFALAHPGIRCEFKAPPSAPDKVPVAKVGSIHRDLAILEVTAGAKRWFEIWEDFSSMAGPVSGQGNHELRDRLEAWAKRNKLKAEFDSEIGGMLIRSPKSETVAACLDALLDGRI